MATHAMNPVHAGVFPQKCVSISVRVQNQDRVPTNAVQERAPERATNSATNFGSA